MTATQSRSWSSWFSPLDAKETGAADDQSGGGIDGSCFRSCTDWIEWMERRRERQRRWFAPDMTVASDGECPNQRATTSIRTVRPKQESQSLLARLLTDLTDRWLTRHHLNSNIQLHQRQQAGLKLHQSHEQLSLVVEEAPAQLVRVKVQAEQDNQQHKRLSLEMASRTLVASLKSSPPKSAECPSHRFSTSAIGN